MEVVRIWDSNSKLLFESDYNHDECCKPMGVGEYCGGCINCIMMQASHLGLLIEISDETTATE